MKKNVEIIKAKNMGFCFGVKRAVKLTEDALGEGKKVYILGPLIHNPQEIERLSSKGACIIKDSEEAEKGTIIIRSHGITPLEKEKISLMGLDMIDATCPYVKKVQHMAGLLHREGYDVIIAGDAGHPEVKGILGFAPGAFVVKDIKELEKIDLKKTVGVLAQTTQKRDFFLEIVKYLIPSTFELRIFNTICKATEERQNAAEELAAEVDLMIVIGGKSSANTNKLASICRSRGVKTCHIEEPQELDREWFLDVKKVGITAGASTPEWLIDRVFEKVKELC